MQPQRTSMLDPRAYCARMLVVCPDGKIFVVKTNTGQIQLPGGGSEKIDDGNPGLTALRELAEETNIKIFGKYVTGRLSEIKYNKKAAFHVWICYKILLTQGEVEQYKPDVYEDGLHVGTVLRLFPKDIVATMGNDMTRSQYEVVLDHIQGIYQRRYSSK